MEVRSYRPEDVLALEAIWERQGLAKDFPPLDAPDFLVTQVVEDEGRIVAAATARQTIEPFIFVDRQKGHSSPHRRWKAVQILEAELGAALNKKHFYESHVFVDPQMANFGKRLMSLGWNEMLWKCYAKEWPRG
jgi:hypothetical protein